MAESGNLPSREISVLLESQEKSNTPIQSENMEAMTAIQK